MNRTAELPLPPTTLLSYILRPFFRITCAGAIAMEPDQISAAVLTIVNTLRIIQQYVQYLQNWTRKRQQRDYYTEEDMDTEGMACGDWEVLVVLGQCEKTQDLMEQLEALQIISHVKHLQEGLYGMKTWSKSIIQKKEELQENLTTLFHAVVKVEQSTASVAKDVSLKIATVKTDIRRISGLVSDVTSLTDSLQALEDKVDKAEKKTVQNIGDLLTSSIDRTAKLRSFASDNSKRIEQIKITLSDLRGDFNKHSDRLLNLESNRAKVLKTVTFANDLKPKVYNLKKDFARLEPMINELTLRIGRLVDDILQREKEIVFLNEKLSNLTTVQTEIKDMKDEITKILDMN
ncbi:Inhibitor of nuclear factor kappa-B kinase-interacting protein [Chelonia mydas]|uniref:Inhibitor of nuclear factor kappa-B kinase-interacting protein n=1 Tax=Chelonia mydas TaxID=8469 RepID=M7AV77_CHEMY|nr:Inhibitor of nuclear factor kappa-B kinase-interacting protein [Chelonia mydas]